MGGFSIFGIGFGELIFILIFAGVFLGPQRIRTVARAMGKYTAYLQRAMRQFRTQLTSELDTAEQAELRAALADIRDLQKQMSDLRGELQATGNAFVGDTKALLQGMEDDVNALGDTLNTTDAEPQVETNGSTPTPPSAPPPPKPDYPDENEIGQMQSLTTQAAPLPKLKSVDGDPE